MSIGLLFLGGARYSVDTTNESIASLVAAFYPYWQSSSITSSASVMPSQPLTTTENSSHLQALRHLYVLSSSPRYICPVDIETSNFCSVLFKFFGFYITYFLGASTNNAKKGKC